MITILLLAVLSVMAFGHVMLADRRPNHPALALVILLLAAPPLLLIGLLLVLMGDDTWSRLWWEVKGLLSIIADLMHETWKADYE